MTVEYGQSRQVEGGSARGVGRVSALVLLLAAMAVAGGLRSPSSAQESWVPTVATTPGGTFHAPPPGAAKRNPPIIDSRLFPSPRAPAAQVRDPLPQGAWSPIVTGGIPQPRGAPSSADSARYGAPNAVVPPLDRLTPLRPNNVRAMVAAGSANAGGSGGANAPAGPAPAGSAAAGPSGDGAATDAAGGGLFKTPGPLDALPPNANAAQQYCFNTVDTAADARFAWQAKKIQDMEAQLDKRARQLEAKTEEYKRWLERRDVFSRKAHEKLVGFYSRMRPDAAALQLAALDEETAAAVVTKLETKVASQIMGEMDPERAAKIATIISGAAKIPPERGRAAGQTDSKPPGAPDAVPPPEGPRS